MKYPPREGIGLKKGAVALLLTGSLIILLGIKYFFIDRIFPGVYVGTLYMGSLLPGEARRALTKLALEEAGRPIKLLWEDRILTTTPGALGLMIDIEDTLARAWAVGRTGPWWQRLRALWPGKRHEVDLAYKYHKDMAQACLEHLIGPLRVEPKDAHLEVDSRGQVRLVPAREGWAVAIEELWSALEKLPSRDLEKPVKIPVERLIPAVTTEEIARRGIIKAVSSYSTFFNPAEKNRLHNIRLAAQALDEKWLKPGEEISFNELVGPRTVERGYLEALVIESLEFIPGVGGGVCQVSTTLYNAALRAGFTIVERQPHALKVGYVPPGLDATVAYGLIDLRLRNDTPYWYWLKAEVGQDSLTFTFYGPQEAPQVEVVSEIVEKVPPPQEIKEDPTLPAGKTFIERQGQWGYRVKVKRRWTFGENFREEIVSQDYYLPVPQVIRQGVG